MKFIIRKDGDELRIKELALKEDGNESEIDFNYIRYIGCYLSNQETVEFTFSNEIDEDTKTRVLKLDSEIKTIVCTAANNQGKEEN